VQNIPVACGHTSSAINKPLKTVHDATIKLINPKKEGYFMRQFPQTQIKGLFIVIIFDLNLHTQICGSLACVQRYEGQSF